MIYRTITIRAEIAENRLYRVLKVREDLDLFEFVIYVISSFGGNCSHLFSIHAGGIHYELPYEIEVNGYDDAINIMKADVKDLPKRFTIEYDFGDDWEFACVIDKKKEDLKNQAPVIFVDGKGAGIWEDNRWSLEMYYGGEIDPSTSEDNEDLGFYMPFDFDFEKVSEQDKPLDAEDQNRNLQLSKAYLNDLWERWDSDSVQSRRAIPFAFDDDEDDDDDDEEFDYGSFAEYVDLAEDAFELMTKGKDYSKKAKASLKAFRDACEELKKEGELPSRFGDLAEQYEEADLNTLILELTDENPLVKSDPDFLLDFINYLFDTFTFELKHEESLKAEIFNCYEEKMDYEAAENFVNAWLSAYPESDEAKAARIHLLIDLKKFKDGKAYLKELDLQNTEINLNNYHLFLAAREFYDLAKDRKNYRWIDEVISDHDEKLLNRFSDIMDQLGIGDDDDDYYDDDEYDQDFMEEELFDAVQLVNRRPDEEALKKLFYAMMDEIVHDGLALIGYYDDETDENGDRLPLLARNENGDTFLCVYSCDRAADNDHAERTELFTFAEILQKALDLDLSGAILDPLDEVSYAVMSKENIQDILRILTEDDDDIPEFLA